MILLRKILFIKKNNYELPCTITVFLTLKTDFARSVYGSNVAQVHTILQQIPLAPNLKSGYSSQSEIFEKPHHHNENFLMKKFVDFSAL